MRPPQEGALGSSSKPSANLISASVSNVATPGGNSMAELEAAHELAAQDTSDEEPAPQPKKPTVETLCAMANFGRTIQHGDYLRTPMAPKSAARTAPHVTEAGPDDISDASQFRECWKHLSNHRGGPILTMRSAFFPGTNNCFFGARVVM